MGILELFFNKEKKPVYKKCGVVIGTKRTPVENMNSQYEEYQAKQKEEELLNKIRRGIEESRTIRKKYHCDAINVIKYVNFKASKLEEKVTSSDYNNNNVCSFYKQYTEGALVVPI